MRIIDVQQGTDAWRAHRKTHRNASEASVMMGASEKVKRNDLIRVLATGIEREYSEWVENVLFARGHAVEVLARPIAERIVGDDLFPVVGAHDDGIESASFDGLTMCGTTAWECKQWNEEKAAIVRSGRVPTEDVWQCIQQFYVSDASRLLYMVTDGTEERSVWTWMKPPTPRDFMELLAGWKQLDADVAAYQHQPEVIPAVPAPVEALPAVSVRMDGAIAVVSNLDAFGERLKAFIEAIDKSPSTDQAFADAEAAVKTLERAQAALEQAEAAALAQTSSIDDMRRTVRLYADMARTTRLTLEKVVKARKEQIRVEIAQTATQAFQTHVSAINKRLGKVTLPPITPNFGGVIKGKKTVSSVRSAVDDELARVKIEASALGERFDANLRALQESAPDHGFLFRDLQQIVNKDADDFAALVRLRVADHKAAEERRLEAERERIREQERQRAEAAAAAKQKADLDAERARIREEEQAKARAEAAKAPEVVTQAEQIPLTAPGKSVEPPKPVSALPAEPPKAPQAPAAKGSLRPSDDEIVEVLALHYRAHEARVIGWLAAFDAEAARNSRRIAA